MAAPSGGPASFARIARTRGPVAPPPAPTQDGVELQAEPLDPASKGTVVEARGLEKTYGDRAVLDGVALGLSAGDGLLIRGRSGSGKSTLLHLLAGLDTPTHGSVALLGRDLGTLTAGERAGLRLHHVGLVFQHFNLIPDLTAEENVRLPMTLARREGAKSRAAQLLAQVGLASRARAFPGALSGGEMQRVAIARALANEPALILADEPTANLDEPNAAIVLDLLAGLARGGRAVVVASHDSLALRVFPRRLHLHQGRLVPSGAAPMP